MSRGTRPAWLDVWRSSRPSRCSRRLLGIDGPFSNLNAPPGTTGMFSGGVEFSPKGRRMGVGFLPTPNPDFSQGVVLAGVMRCR
jgi:hypothetical protein